MKKVNASRLQISKAIASEEFQIIVIILILLNTVFLAIEYDGMPSVLTVWLDKANIFFTLIFAVEMVIKLYGLGFCGYLQDGFNIFDGVIVLFGLFELLGTLVGISVNSSGFTVLRAFRLLRIFKIVKSWKMLKKLLQTVIDAFGAITNLGLLMFLLVFIYSLLGMQFFSTDLIEEDGSIARYNFGSFGHSLITIFIILTGENWNEVMYLVINNHGYVAAFYFVTLMIFGNFMLLNLFLAILLQQLGESVDEKAQDEDND